MCKKISMFMMLTVIAALTMHMYGIVYAEGVLVYAEGVLVYAGATTPTAVSTYTMTPPTATPTITPTPTATDAFLPTPCADGFCYYVWLPMVKMYKYVPPTIIPTATATDVVPTVIATYTPVGTPTLPVEKKATPTP